MLAKANMFSVIVSSSMEYSQGIYHTNLEALISSRLHMTSLLGDGKLYFICSTRGKPDKLSDCTSVKSLYFFKLERLLAISACT